MKAKQIRLSYNVRKVVYIGQYTLPVQLGSILYLVERGKKDSSVSISQRRRPIQRLIGAMTQIK